MPHRDREKSPRRALAATPFRSVLAAALIAAALSMPGIFAAAAFLASAPVPGSPAIVSRSADDAPAAEPAAGPAALPAAYVETIPGTGVSFRMVPVPPRDGEPGFWIGATEVTWEVFDLFVFGEDAPVAGEPSDGEGGEGAGGLVIDAYTRPSKPYVPPDRGFGHEGYPVISASAANAREFCRWLSAKTGRRYRPPLVDEWRHAAAAGSEGRFATGDDPAALPEVAWFAENSEGTTHPVGTKRANVWGLHDAHGNAGEWCLDTGGEGKARWVLCGGSFRDDADALALDALRAYERSWQMSDPQLPKSRWWLSDAPFAGLRVLRSFPAAQAGGSGEEPSPDESARAAESGGTSGTHGSP